tara:strand:+ start:6662 stop:7051 length:390 start_codon:yes stop_codon:yes gene_type:complete
MVDAFDLTDSDEYQDMVRDGVNKLLPIVTPTTVAMQGSSRPNVAPDWIVMQFARIQAELMSLKLELLVMNAALSLQTMGMATEGDEHVTEILKVAKARMDKFVDESVAAHKEAKLEQSSKLVTPDGTTL